MTPDDERGAPEHDSPKGGKRTAKAPSAGAFAGFGLQFVIALLLFLYLGQWVDRKLGTAPLFLIVGVFVGAGASFYSMYRSLTAQQKRARDEKGRGGE